MVAVSRIEGTDLSGRETYEIIKLNSGHATVDTGDHLLGDGNGVDVVGIQAVAEPGHAGRDLVKLNALLAPIWRGVRV